MLLITAALREELNIALSICRDPATIRQGGVEFWQAVRNGQTIRFLKTGIGPGRSAACLANALEIMDISNILVLGYAGALDPHLKLGTLVVVEKALACGFDKADPAVENMILERTFVLPPSDSMLRTSESLNLPVRCGDTLTSAHVWGNPEHKKILMRKFGASIVDMETAALARVSENANIPLRCVRVVSDEAGDSFLEPFSYDPSAGLPKRAGRFIRRGAPVKAFRTWKHNALEARRCLSRFISGYL